MVFNPVEPWPKLSYTGDQQQADPDGGQHQHHQRPFVPGRIQTQYGTYTGPDASQLLRSRGSRPMARRRSCSKPGPAELAHFAAFTYTLKPDLPARRTGC